MFGLFLKTNGRSSPPGVSMSPSLLFVDSLKPADEALALLEDMGGREMNVGADLVFGLL